MEAVAKIVGGGNIKLGNTIGTWSTLFGDAVYDTPFGKVQGTCGHHCEHCGQSVNGKRPPCYVAKSYRYGSVIKRHAENTVAMRKDVWKCFKDLHGQLTRKRNKFVYVRIDQSGELETIEQLKGWEWLAEEHRETTFYIYTKAYAIVLPELLNGNVPKNLVVLISIWHEQGIDAYKTVKHLTNVKAFVYMDKNSNPDGWWYEEYAAHGIEIQTICKAYDEKGKMNHDITCDKCKKCIACRKNTKVIGCFDH